MVYMVSCFDLNWKLLALPLWEPVSHAQKRMMSLVPRVPQALLVNIRNGYPDTHGCSPFLLIFPVPTNDLPWKHLRCIPIGTMVFPRTRIKGCFWVVFAGTWRYPWLFHEDLWSTLTIQLQIHKYIFPIGVTQHGKRLHNYGKIHHFSWENSPFLWPFSMSQTVSHYQRINYY